MMEVINGAMAGSMAMFFLAILGLALRLDPKWRWLFVLCAVVVGVFYGSKD